MLAESDSVIHTVGALLDNSAPLNYKQVIKDMQECQISKKNPVELVKEVANEIYKK